MKAVKLFFAVMIAIGAMIIGAGFFMDSTWRAEASLAMEAEPAVLYDLAAHLHRWQDWTTWNEEMDPKMTRTYDGEDGTVGASMSWEGPQAGRGRLVITSAEPNRKLTYDLYFDDNPEPSKVVITFEPKDGRTLVTWSDEGDVGGNPIGRLMVSTIEQMVAEDFAKGLAKMAKLGFETQHRQRVEAAAKASAAAEAKAHEGLAVPIEPAGSPEP